MVVTLFRSRQIDPNVLLQAARRRGPAAGWATLLSLGLFALSLVGGVSQAAAATPAETLLDMVSRQKTLLAAAEKKPSQHELEDLRQPLQELCYEYEDFLRKNPKLAEAYVSYAALLDHPIIDERRRSTALLLKANQLNPELARVKNQLGNHVAEDGRPLEALNYFLAAIRLEPKEPLYHYQLGTLLVEARDDFLKSGEWTADKIDSSLLHAFHEAARLEPDNWRYSYRYGLAFYDVAKPDWAAALVFWQEFEARLKPGVEQQTSRLHQARALAGLGARAKADEMLATVTEPALAKQKEKLAAEWAALAAPAGSASAPARPEATEPAAGK
ncbi:MAG: hypothetical protein JNN01_10370 [Opitutaceae bacterium]|nr:hypothetical protein [Opitutaceae bacterium]